MTHQTLEALMSEILEENLEPLKDGKLRPYKVTVGETVQYTLAKSLGQAALAVCTVEVCDKKKVYAATLDAMMAKKKGGEK